MKKNLLLFFLMPIIGFAQKAYDAVYYTGKTQNITVKLTLANGYITASEIKTVDNTTKKASKFLPSDGSIGDDKKMKFNHVSSSNKPFTDYFILEGMEENYDKVPKKIIGNYYFNGILYPVVFSKT